MTVAKTQLEKLQSEHQESKPKPGMLQPSCCYVSQPRDSSNLVDNIQGEKLQSEQ